MYSSLEYLNSSQALFRDFSSPIALDPLQIKICCSVQVKTLRWSDPPSKDYHHLSPKDPRKLLRQRMSRVESG
jgi:hypothetical protein